MFYILNLSAFKKHFHYLHLMQTWHKFDQNSFRYCTYLCFGNRITTERIHVQWGKKVTYAFRCRCLSGWFVQYTRNIWRICLAYLIKRLFHILKN